MAKIDSNLLKDLILNTSQPVVLKGCPPNWEIFGGTLEDWCQELDAASQSPLSFEQMPLVNGNTPQWERRRKMVEMKAMDFLETHSRDGLAFWSGLNYKRAFDMPKECTRDIDFGYFGFPSIDKDFSFWLSSKGANTPCHYDSYGCNIVIQVFGKKSWLLFPPNAPLTASRIPYEESSVYCSENFFSPKPESLEGFRELAKLSHHCVLEPTDVLIVPPHWWHYVESIENSLSINYWVPLDIDYNKQLDECIVKYLCENFLLTMTPKEKFYVMNPNQMDDVTDKETLLGILQHLVDNKSNSHIIENYPYGYMDQESFETLLKSFTQASVVGLLPVDDFMDMLINNSHRYDPEADEKQHPLTRIHETLLNSILNPETIALMKKDFVERYDKSQPN